MNAGVGRQIVKRFAKSCRHGKLYPVRKQASDMLFNEAELLDRTDNDRDFARELIGLFMKTTGEALAELEQCIQDHEDAAVIRKLAHSLKGAAATASAVAVASCAANLEQLSGGTEASAALEALRAAFHNTVALWEQAGWTSQEA
jgi:HPt (histidine-containing phosphotransfer) domain-containing protein